MTQLSSKSTYFWKIAFPILVVIALSITTVLLYSKQGYFYSLIIIDVLLIPLYFTTIYKAKKVSFDDKFLYISNLSKEDKIPLTRILEVNEIWMTPKMANIILKEACGFGLKIKYIQRASFLKLGSENPDLEKLYEAVKKKAQKELNESRKTKKRIYNLFAE